MDKLYVIRDAFFWWAGVWATVTMCNRAIRNIRVRRDGRKREEHEQYSKEFFAEMQRRHAEEDAEKAKEAPEESEAGNATET